MWAIGEPSGPMLKGITYIVRPRIAALEQLVERRPHLVRVQPVVGRPGVLSSSEQMKVRSSTRATSPGSLRARKQLGRSSSREPDEGARLDQRRAEPVVLVLRAVAPVERRRAR